MTRAYLRAGYWYWLYSASQVSLGLPVRLMDAHTGEYRLPDGTKGYAALGDLRVVDALTLNVREASYRAMGTWNFELAAYFMTVRSDNRLPTACAPLTMGWFQHESFLRAARGLAARTSSAAVRADCGIALGLEPPRELDSIGMACERVARELAMERVGLMRLVGEFFAALSEVDDRSVWAIASNAPDIREPLGLRRLAAAERDLRTMVGLLSEANPESRIEAGIANLGAADEPRDGWQVEVLRELGIEMPPAPALYAEALPAPALDPAEPQPSWWRRLFRTRRRP